MDKIVLIKEVVKVIFYCEIVILFGYFVMELVKQTW
jgi:hypothetical protein